MTGKELGSEGKGGVLKKTTFEHYEAFLGKAYSLVDRSPAYVPLYQDRTSGGYDDAIWVNSDSPDSAAMLRKNPVSI